MRLFATARDVDVALSVWLAEQMRDQVSVERHTFSANRAHTREPLFNNRITMRTAVDDAILFGGVHRSPNARDYVLAFCERAVAKRASNKKPFHLSFFLPCFFLRFFCLNTHFPRKKTGQSPNDKNTRQKYERIR